VLSICWAELEFQGLRFQWIDTLYGKWSQSPSRSCEIIFCCTSSCAEHMRDWVEVFWGFRFRWIDYTVREVEPIISEILWDFLLLHVAGDRYAKDMLSICNLESSRRNRPMLNQISSYSWMLYCRILSVTRRILILLKRLAEMDELEEILRGGWGVVELW
jgi:hypothetical protein